MKQDTRIPVTLLTGFLGAGKTTLLNHMMRDPDAGRIAVIMNELGDVGLDHDLIEESTEETILMHSGCLCCTFRSDISTTLDGLLSRRTTGELAFDRIVIETTGIADPGPIHHTLAIDKDIAANFRLDGIVTLADAATGTATLKTHDEAVQQIAMADLIVITKSDLVSHAKRTEFETRIATLNATAQRICADFGRVDPHRLFNLSALRPNATPVGVSNWLSNPFETQPPKSDPLDNLSGLGGTKPALDPFQSAMPPAHHNNRIASASLEIQDPIPTGLFDFWLEKLVTMNGPNILRMKGLIHFREMPHPYVFHGVQHIFDNPVPLTSWTGTDTTSKVVIIARDTSQETLQASLKTLSLKPAKPRRTNNGMSVETIELG